MKLSLIDTHCDTAFELYHRRQELLENNCHISLTAADIYENYTQFFAVWANKRRSDDQCFDDFIKISDNLSTQIEKYSDKVTQARTFDEMVNAWNAGKRAIFLAVEDARILAGNIDRIDVLKSRGVSYMTLLWGGDTCVGSSHDKDGGLTPFGKEVVHRCFSVGILPDVSHANERVTDEVTEIAFEYNKPFIASHSNCYKIYPHTRNLREKHIDAMIKLGGIVGLNLCPYHVTDMSGGICTVDDVMRHVEGYLSLGCENILGMGCDLDGTDLPQGFSSVRDLSKIAEAMARLNYSDELINKIFYKNYYEFIKRNF